MAARRRLPARVLVPLLVLTLGGTAAACGDDEGPSVSLSSPSDGARIAGSVELAMEADGLTIEEAGEVHDAAGHFHVIADDGCVAKGAAVPRDADHVHFGKGQAEGRIYLEPGSHELCLQVGDGAHVALPATDRVSVTVGVTDLEQWCRVIGEVDELFSATDNSSDDFAVKQVGYANIGRLVAQLTDAIDQVDQSARQDVTAALGFVTEMVTIFTEANDFGEAEAQLEGLFERRDDWSAAQSWILGECDVDIDG